MIGTRGGNGAARRPRIAIVGAGVAGAVVANALAARDDVEVVCVERARRGEHAEAGTGLNVGPNAVKALDRRFPALSARVHGAALPWRHWTVSLTDGTPLMSLALAEVADNPGIRIRWSDLYRTLREPIADRVLFGTTVEALDLSPADGATLALRAADGGTRVLEGVDLVIAADGRYSPVRAAHFGRETPRQLGVVIYRVLMEADESAPVDDYGQWFNGPNRLLAFRVPGDAVYCAGTFTIPAGAPVPEDMRTPERLAALYVPPAGLDRASAFLVDGIMRNLDQIHWARMQEGTIRFAHPSGRLLLLGDAAHPMVPTLGQGATMAIEDGCVTADALDEALAAGTPLADVPATVAARRTERVAFAMGFSVEASDTLLPDTDVVAATREKTAAPFRDKLVRLYRHGP